MGKRKTEGDDCAVPGTRVGSVPAPHTRRARHHFERRAPDGPCPAMALISPQGRRREGEASEAGVEDFDGVPATDVDPATSFERGVALEERGKPEEDDSWYRLAADAGHPAAANNLGLLLDGRGAPEGAEAWYRR